MKKVTTAKQKNLSEKAAFTEALKLAHARMRGHHNWSDYMKDLGFDPDDGTPCLQGRRAIRVAWAHFNKLRKSRRAA